jgi:signal transduction histidine kinase
VLLDLTVAQTHRDIDDAALMKGMIEPVALTRDVVELLGNPLAQRIQVSAEAPLPTLIGDDRLLRFALLNLLDNACKYSPPDTSVRVSIAADAANVIWRVEDEGPGIPPGMEERIFEKYVRASEAGSKAGLGLGLYLARHIIERHGGTLTATTGRTRGACFICRLPAAPTEDLH